MQSQQSSTAALSQPHVAAHCSFAVKLSCPPKQHNTTTHLLQHSARFHRKGTRDSTNFNKVRTSKGPGEGVAVKGEKVCHARVKMGWRGEYKNILHLPPAYVWQIETTVLPRFVIKEISDGIVPVKLLLERVK